MEIILLISILVIQIIIIFFLLTREKPSMEILRKDLHILDRNVEILKNQIIILDLKNNLNSNRIGIIEEFCVKNMGNKNSNPDYN